MYLSHSKLSCFMEELNISATWNPFVSCVVDYLAGFSNKRGFEDDQDNDHFVAAMYYVGRFLPFHLFHCILLLENDQPWIAVL